MAVNFPSNPTNGDTVTVGGINYVYDSTQGVWSDSPQGLTQSIDNLTDVDTSTTAPANRQVLQWNSTNEEWGPADSGVQVYATIDDLPLSGVTEGSMALVDSTDKLYIFSDTGWYSIAIVNQTPSISGVEATYNLATDGTATTVTITATDPEGIPITYSIVSDTSGNIATVAQGTGANTNQWTITPSTDEANAGSFSLTFRASDGTNIASASSTFVLVFTIENSQYTSALITSVGANNDTNNTYTDSSSSSQTVTKLTNNERSTWSPYRPGGHSVYFDGTGDYLTGPSNDSSFNFGTGDFTIECWIYNDGGSTATFFAGTTNGDMDVAYDSSGLRLGRTNTAWDVTQTYTLPAAWTHIAVVRTSGTVKFFANGTQVGSDVSNTTSYTIAGSQKTGVAGDNSSRPTTGYITDLRVVKGTAVYTSAFTPPDQRLTAITNTSLLACQLPYIADASTNDHTITKTGDCKIEPKGPYELELYDASIHGGSVHFNAGVTDPIRITDDAGMEPGSDDFQVEFWSYRVGTAPTGWSFYFATSGTGGASFLITGVTTNTIHVANGNGSTWSFLSSTGYTHPQYEWTHMAVTRVSNTWKFYANGKLQYTNTSNTAAVVDYAGPKGLGDGWSTSQAMDHHISDFRFIKGSVTYTSDFTPPTQCLTATNDTTCLLNFGEDDILDKTASVKAIDLNGDVKSSTTQSKYLTSSIYFDGSGDYIEVIDALGEFTDYSNATLEMWVYPTTSSGSQNLIEKFTPGSGPGWTLYTTSGTLNLQWYGGGTTNSSGAMTVNQWNHVAVVHYNGTRKIYVNGTGGTGVSFTSTVSSNPLRIGVRGTTGSFFTGYMSDIRIQLGRAVYTADFTPPTAALEG